MLISGALDGEKGSHSSTLIYFASTLKTDELHASIILGSTFGTSRGIHGSIFISPRIRVFSSVVFSELQGTDKTDSPGVKILRRLR